MYNKEFLKKVANWLSQYTDSVVKDVMAQIDEIYEDDASHYLLNELYDREKTEENNFINTIENLANDFNTFSKYDAHNAPLTHAQSYRNVLYDMWIDRKYR